LPAAKSNPATTTASNAERHGVAFASNCRSGFTRRIEAYLGTPHKPGTQPRELNERVFRNRGGKGSALLLKSGLRIESIFEGGQANSPVERLSAVYPVLASDLISNEHQAGSVEPARY